MVDKNQRESSSANSGNGDFSPDIRLTIALVLVARRWRSVLDERLRAIHQGTARMEALSAIYNSPEATSQVNIARRLRIEGPTLTRMIDSLEKDGLVERLADPEDRRTKKLKVTPAGKAALEEIFAIADTYRKRLLVDISAEEVTMMNELLSGMLDKLDDGLPDPEA
jgi:MarR family transcriptional regulator for hemolysin